MTDCPLTPADLYPLAEYPTPSLSNLSNVVLINLFFPIYNREIFLSFQQIVLDFTDVAFDRLFQKTG